MRAVSESTVRSRNPPPPSLKGLEDVFHKEQYSISMETIQNLHETIPRKVQAVFRQMVAQLPFNKERWIFHNCFHYFVHPV